jgi:5'-3' exonuclease
MRFEVRLGERAVGNGAAFGCVQSRSTDLSRCGRREFQAVVLFGTQREPFADQRKRFAVRGLPPAAFERADRVQADPRALRQRFLRKAGLDSELTEQRPERQPGVGRQRRAGLIGREFARARESPLSFHVPERRGSVRGAGKQRSVIVHLVDGTYELFRHFYGARRFNDGKDRPFGAVVGVLNTALQMIEEGATHIGFATDHVIESFRNELWSEYKTGAGIEPSLRAQFEPLEEALAAMGVVVWPTIELEADDALASAATIADRDPRVERVCIWTPDKDLSQCVRAERVVQVDRKSKIVRDAAGVRAKFGVDPELIPDYLALVGDSADGFPGIAGIGPKGAVALLTRYGRLEDFPPQALGERLERALLFKKLATLRSDASLFADVDELRWHGPQAEFSAYCERIDAPRLASRAESAPRIR